MSLITENNRQYYEGAQGFRFNGSITEFTTTFDTNLKFSASQPTDVNYPLNNFKIYTSSTALPGTWTEYDSLNYSVTGNTISFAGSSVTISTVAPSSVNYVDIDNLTGSANVGEKVQIVNNIIRFNLNS